MFQVNDTPHNHWRESLHFMVIKLIPCSLYRNKSVYLCKMALFS